MAANRGLIPRFVAPLDVGHYVEKPTKAKRRREVAGESASGIVIPREVESQGQLFRFPPSFAPPPGAQDFQRTGRSTVAGPSTTTILGNTTFTIPRGSVGYIRSLTWDANALSVTSDISFTVLFNQAPVPGWQDLRLFPRAASSASLAYSPDETYIWVPDGQTISLQVTVTDGASYLIGGQYHGWYFSKSIAAEYGLAGR
jgi:hypothetical protein